MGIAIVNVFVTLGLCAGRVWRNDPGRRGFVSSLAVKPPGTETGRYKADARHGDRALQRRKSCAKRKIGTYMGPKSPNGSEF